jgi:hypothetical protein
MARPALIRRFLAAALLVAVSTWAAVPAGICLGLIRGNCCCVAAEPASCCAEEQVASTCSCEQHAQNQTPRECDSISCYLSAQRPYTIPVVTEKCPPVVVAVIPVQDAIELALSSSVVSLSSAPTLRTDHPPPLVLRI